MELCQSNFSIFEISFVTYCKFSCILPQISLNIELSAQSVHRIELPFIRNHFVILKQKGVYKTYLLTIEPIFQPFIHHQFQTIEIELFFIRLTPLEGIRDL